MRRRSTGKRSGFRVLVATDGSPSARAALMTACVFPWPRDSHARSVVALPPERFIGADVLILAAEHGDRVQSEPGRAFDAMETLPDVSICHAGRTLQTVKVFQARRLRVWPPPG